MAGYDRQSAADIIASAIVKSAPLNNELNQLQTAFALSGGHSHDGSSTEGAYVPLISDVNAYNKVVVDNTNDRLSFFVEVATAAVEQFRVEDGVIKPVTDSDIDLGTTSLRFKDFYTDTVTTTDGITVGGNLTVNGNTTLGDAATDTVTITADVASSVLPSVDDNYDIGAVGAEWRNLYIDGTAYMDAIESASVNIDGGNIDGTVIGAATPAAADFTTMDTTGNATVGGTLGVTGLTTVADLTSTGTSTHATVDINGGAIDGTTIGATSAAAVTGTTITANTTFSGALSGNVTGDVTGNVTGNVTGDVTGDVTSTGTSSFATVTTSGDLTVGGDLTVNGTTTTISTTNTVVADTLMELGNGTTGAPANDAGIVIERGSSNNAFIGFDESEDKFKVGTGTFTGASTGNLTVTTGTLIANLEGNVTGDLTGNLSGTTQFGTLSDGTIGITAWVDEDNMVSDSATLVPTQQSVKSYVDTVAGQSNNVTGLTATGAELNNLDASAVTPATMTIVGTDGIPVIDVSGPTTTTALASDILDYIAAATSTFTNKTLTSPTVTGLHLDDAGFTVEGSTADGFETTMTFTDPTADRTITIPDASGTVLLDSVNNDDWSGADLEIANGGTGASSAAAARTNLGVVIGTDVQAYDAQLADIAALAVTDGNIIVGDGTNWVAESGATARTSLGLGSSSTLDEATSAQYRNNTADKVLTTDQVWSAVDEVGLTDGASIAVDLDSGINFNVTLAGNRTLSNPTNTTDGQAGYIRVVQDATGSRTLSFGTNYEFAGGTAPTLTTTASATDILFYQVLSSTRIIVTNVLDIS